MADIVPLKTARRASKSRTCPMCQKPAAAAYAPFCSKRCADLDLGKWLEGDYRVPTDEVPEDSDYRELERQSGEDD